MYIENLTNPNQPLQAGDKYRTSPDKKDGNWSYGTYQPVNNLDSNGHVGTLVLQDPTKVGDDGALLDVLKDGNTLVEATVVKGTKISVLANLLADPNDTDSLLDSVPDQTFRVPLISETGNRNLVLASLESGVVTVVVTLNEVGYWELNEEAINERLPDGVSFGISTATFVVVDADPSILAKLSS